MPNHSVDPAYEHARDFWDQYYGENNDELCRISDPEEHIQERLMQQDPTLHPIQAQWLGRTARTAVIEQLQLS